MGLILAVSAFFKALRGKNKEQALLFLGHDKKDESGEAKNKESGDHSHLRLLGLLQQSGRLIDFFKEDISQFSDAQVGAAVRKIHDDCAERIEELVTIRSVVEQKEGEKLTIPVGYDPAEYKLVGNVKGEAPFTGTLRHKGWRAHKLQLPKKVVDGSNEIICPAEVEV